MRRFTPHLFLLALLMLALHITGVSLAYGAEVYGAEAPEGAKADPPEVFTEAIPYTPATTEDPSPPIVSDLAAPPNPPPRLAPLPRVLSFSFPRQNAEELELTFEVRNWLESELGYRFDCAFETRPSCDRQNEIWIEPLRDSTETLIGFAVLERVESPKMRKVLYLVSPRGTVSLLRLTQDEQVSISAMDLASF